jgi:hypothetical protein
MWGNSHEERWSFILKTKNFLQISLAALLALCVTFILVGGGATTVQKADKSFGTVLKKHPAHRIEPGRWSLSSLDGEVLFSWGSVDMGLTADVAPFVAAGLQTAKLKYADKFGLDFASLPFAKAAAVKKDAAAQFSVNLKKLEKYLDYDAKTDTYTLTIANKTEALAAVRWGAKNGAILFAVNPAPLLRAGLNPKVTPRGWKRAAVPFVLPTGRRTETWFVKS